MSTQTVRQACKISDLVERDDLVDQIANLEDLNDPASLDAQQSSAGTILPKASHRLLYTGFERLSGRSDTGAFYLSQSMGGGKTHSLIAFGLLARDPALRQRIVPKLAEKASFGAAKIVVFNGHQNPKHFLWGHIAEQLGRAEKMSRFWRDGADAPGIDDWIATIGPDPVLILLDELPSYLQMASGRTVGKSTLADVTIGGLERLFNALPKLPNACVVVTNLKDDIYAQGSGKLRTLIDDLTKQYDKFATPITPVQQNSAEVFQIIRKKLFDTLPSDDVVEELAQTYVDVLNSARRSRLHRVYPGNVHLSRPRNLPIPSVDPRHSGTIQGECRVPTDTCADPDLASRSTQRDEFVRQYLPDWSPAPGFQRHRNAGGSTKDQPAFHECHIEGRGQTREMRSQNASMPRSSRPLRRRRPLRS